MINAKIKDYIQFLMESIFKILQKNYKSVLLILIIIFLITIFASIFEDVWTKDIRIINFDINNLNYINNHRINILNQYFEFITNFGDITIVLCIFTITSVFLFIKKKYRYLISLILVLAGDGIFIFTLKDIVKRTRPAINNALITESGFSFPSGHSFIALCFYGLITYFMWKNIRNIYLKFICIFISTFLILSIGFSRIYLGVHWTSDVIASLCSSGVFLIIIIYFLEKQIFSSKSENDTL